MKKEQNPVAEGPSPDQVQDLDAEALEKVSGGALRSEESSSKIKETIEIESFSWGATQSGGFG